VGLTADLHSRLPNAIGRSLSQIAINPDSENAVSCKTLRNEERNKP